MTSSKSKVKCKGKCKDFLSNIKQKKKESIYFDYYQQKVAAKIVHVKVVKSMN